jgi:hypothetical protein
MWGETPPDDSKIWRYISLPKLLHLLQTKDLFFASVSSLSKNDPWDGHWAEDEFQDVIATFNRMLNLDWPRVTRDAIKKSTFVNCWYRSDYESAAMWTIYGKDGVALNQQSAR